MPKNQHMGMGNLVPTDYGYSTQPQVSMIGVNPSVIEKLDQLQATRSSPLSISSGYRSKAYNAKVGGARGSQHIRGNAIDIDTRNMSREEVKSLISEASRLGFTGIGVYDTASNQSIHLDVAGRRAWGPSYGAASVPGWAKDVIGAHLENKYQGTSPAPMVAKVERAQLPAVGPVLETKPSQMAMAPQNVSTPTAKPSDFPQGGLLNPTKLDVSKLSPVSSAQAAPARAAPAPSMAQSPARAAASVPAPNPSRFGTTAPNINEANALKSALEAQAAQISAPQNVSAISSLRSLAPTQQAAPAPTKAYSATPASYQTPAFSTAQPKVDAFGQPPAPGLQPASVSQYTPTQPAAPARAAPARTISSPKVASVPAIEAAPSTIGAPVDPALNQFPDRPKPGFGLLSPAQTTPAKIGQITGALLGTAALGPVGGLLGGLLGKAGMNRFGGGLLDPYDGPTNNIGSGMQAVSSVMGGGMAPGSTASASNGQTVTSLPGGGVQRTSKKYGWTEITTADGRTTRAKSTRGAGGNYGGVKSEKARDAIDKGIGGLF